MKRLPATAAGLGLRRSMLPELDVCNELPARVDFFEVAPENWLGIGGRLGKTFRRYTERFPFICHGLSLSLGGPDPLDEIFLQRLKGLLDEHGIVLYSEHLSWCSDGAHLYDLLPIPFTEDAVKHVAARIRRTQDILGRRIAVENASFYTPLASELSEPEFLLAVLAEADCELLLDVNNVYVNSVNHRYDARAFIDRIPAARVAYLHVAGHYHEAPDLIVDTHGADIVDPVWQLLDYSYRRIGTRPTLLERDFNIPPLPQLLTELDRVRAVQARAVDRDLPTPLHAVI
ncbi:MAG: DUF692 domain-containing protein [Xanthomonadales bacterium]|nr:hypothetical protein [Xanthomonadales bacterium]MCC6593203.1 DUF692 domain-containing protein [Xanthomonadales bacterium]MCE7930697.1 DUF692 domain-containing protein [Xanthomonadales bacterium PRO6]